MKKQKKPFFTRNCQNYALINELSRPVHKKLSKKLFAL